MENQLSRTFLWPSLTLLSLPIKIGHEVMWIDSCQRFRIWWLWLTSIRFWGIYYDEHALGYLEEWTCVCVCLGISIFMYIYNIFQTKTFTVCEWAGTIILLYLEFSTLLHRVQICQCLFFSSSRWVRSQWHNQLGSTKREKGSMEQRITQRRKERDKLVEEEMRRINLMMLGPGSSTYLPLHLSVIIHFLCVSLEMEGMRRLFLCHCPSSLFFGLCLCHPECPICNL